VDGAGVDVHAIIVSAVVGFEKPDHRIFKMALKAVGARPSDAIHVGDNVRLDMNERPALAST
jgi:putative hydrolase of the HAD superfamily